MSAKKLKIVENLILITFPVVLFAGCAGNDVKPILSEPSQLDKPQIQTGQFHDPYPKTDLEPVSFFDTQKEPTVENLTTEGEPVISATVISTNEIIEPLEKKNDNVAPASPEKNVFYFDTDVHRLSDEQHNELRQHADYLIANSAAILVINGHADVRGTETYNQNLSEKRAKEIKKLLVELGVNENQLMTKGFGELVPMHAEANWDENRRVELQYTDPMMLTSM